MNPRKVLIGLALAVAARAAAAQTVAIAGVTVIDARTGEHSAPRTVVVRDGRIAALLPGSARPAGAAVVDGRGKFLIPGLWDMHVHVTLTQREVVRLRGAALERAHDSTFASLLTNGVTGVRDMAGDLATLALWRSDVAAGSGLGPRMVFTGHKLAPGKVADLLLLRAAPTVDVANAGAIDAVIVRGRVLAAPMLDSLRAVVRGESSSRLHPALTPAR